MSKRQLMRKATMICTALLSAHAMQCYGQTGYSNYGFHSYANNSGRNYNSGMVSSAPSNSYNTGFAGVTQTSSGRQYSNTNSSNAARALGQQVNNIFSAMLPAAMQTKQAMVPSRQMSGGMMPTSPRQEMMRTFFEGVPPQSPISSFSSAPSGASSSATSTAIRIINVPKTKQLRLAMRPSERAHMTKINGIEKTAPVRLNMLQITPTTRPREQSQRHIPGIHRPAATPVKHGQQPIEREQTQIEPDTTLTRCVEAG